VARPRVRRSRCLVCSWDDGELVIRNFLAGTEITASPGVLGLLDALGSAQPLADLRRKLRAAGAEMVLDALLQEQIVVVDHGEAARHEDKLDAVWRWGVDARHFHFSTRDVNYTFDHEEVRLALTAKARRDPPPSPFKGYRAAPTPLPHQEPSGDFWKTLHARRTCRNFRRSRIDIEQLSALLDETFGMVRYYDGSALDRRLIKTSPSGGARHPIEAYCIVQRVKGVARGLYHYDVRTHGLTRLRTGVREKEVVQLFSGQAWVADAAVVIVMTAVLPRSMWKYDHSRAYRVLMLDAGHLGQTLHLVATELGLGVFTTAALQDRELEQFLGIDGIEEIVVYGGAVGRAASSHAGAVGRPQAKRGSRTDPTSARR
jgi:SagB-type dehydrogenase family enzyme